MTPHEQLFGAYPDWLSHTLALAGQESKAASATLVDGTQIERLGTGVLALTPSQDTSDHRLIVSAGVHGNETAPIEVLNHLVTELLDARWQVRRPTLLILGNPPAMVAGSRFIEHNLNRLFSGAHQSPPHAGSAEAARASWIERTCKRFTGQAQVVHYDLHTAIRPSMREKFALYPYIPDREVSRDQLEFLLASEVPTLLLQHKAGTTFASFSSTELGAESFTIELGQVHPFGENDLSRFAGIQDSLRQLMRNQPPAAAGKYDVSEMVVFEVVEEIIKTDHHFQFHVPDDVANFTEYAPGEIIWQDDHRCYRVGNQPEAIVFPNRDVPVGQRVGLLVRKRQP
ncbi:succinylglutamate desuccinylase [Marinobacter caseinilyticus]|uniref:succinylglutamate desuccinylase n=1 Tax=Marinobacter caseinilyticus TaxID=2692195 RepID=UPI001407B799|nr:succinylglutamate desuccinylase [Marinobacter caseinilyticus]